MLRKALAAIALFLSLTIVGPRQPYAEGAKPHVLTVVACIDGADDLHIRGGKIWWRHLSFTPPGLHQDCSGILSVNGQQWADWRQPLPLSFATDGEVISFEPITCRGNCTLIQKPADSNGWESVYRLDDFRLLGAGVYVVKITIGAIPGTEPPSPNVRHAPPMPAAPTAPSQDHWL